MTTDHKHPTAAFWLTVALVVVLVGYPLSFGPACWISSYVDDPVLAFTSVARVYSPFVSLFWHLEGSVQ